MDITSENMTSGQARKNMDRWSRRGSESDGCRKLEGSGVRDKDNWRPKLIESSYVKDEEKKMLQKVQF